MTTTVALNLSIRRHVYEDLKANALWEAPRECCGLFAVCGHLIEAIWPVPNASDRPTEGFRIAAEDRRKVQPIIERRGRICGVFHSHPISSANPSLVDIRLAEPDVPQLIVGLGKGVVVRAWSIIDRNGIRSIRSLNLEVI